MTTKKTAQPSWTKEEYLKSSALKGAQRDVLNAALENGKTYTADEVKAALKAWKGGLF